MSQDSRNSLLSYPLWVIFAFSIAGILIYLNSFSNPFHYDDIHHITTNPHIRKISDIPALFTDTGTFSSVKDARGGGFHYRPLVMLTYTLNYVAGELNPMGWHLVNLAFHIGSAFLVFLIVKTMLEKQEENTLPFKGRARVGMGFSENLAGFFAPLAAGLIFLVHPFNSEIVNYISTRSSVMGGFFYLLSFYCWVQFRSQKSEARNRNSEGFSNFLRLTSIFYLLSLLAFAAGMLSKEIVITLPVVLVLYDIYGFSEVRSKKEEVRFSIFNIRYYIPYLPFVLLVAVPYLVVRGAWMGKALSGSHRDISTQIYTELPILVKHYQMFFYPSPLTPIHDADIFHSFNSFQVILSFLFIVIYLAVLIIFLYKESKILRTVSFFMLWFFIVLLPTTLVPLGLIFQEHRGYLAGVSFAVIVGIILGWALETKAKSTITALLIIYIGIFSYVTFNRNKVWIDDLSLWSDTVAKSPGSSVAHAGMGIAYKETGAYDKAIVELQKAISLDDGGEEILTARQNLGQVYILQKRWDMAIKEMDNALRIYPENVQFHNDLGIAYYSAGKKDLAERYFSKASEIDPTDYLSFLNLGALYSQEGQPKEALIEYKRALSLAPENMEIRIRIAFLFEGLGEIEKAVEMYRYIIQNAAERDAGIVQEAETQLRKMRIYGY